MSTNAEHQYRVVMSNGDEAECDTIAAALFTAGQLHADSGYATFVDRVELNGVRNNILTVAVRLHVLEIEPRTLETDLAEDR